MSHPATLAFPLPDLLLVFVEGGAFVMGDDESGYNSEKPAHRVVVPSFYMGKYPVTQRLYEAVTGDNPSRFKGPQRPVEQVSWHDAQAFIQKLNGRRMYRLSSGSLLCPARPFACPLRRSGNMPHGAGGTARGMSTPGATS